MHKVGQCDALANLVDLPVTFLELAGIPPANGMQGTSLLRILNGESDRLSETTLVECHATAKLYQQIFVTDRYKLVVYRDLDAGELYDLHRDPNQRSNLWDNQAFAHKRAELLLQLSQWHMRREPRANPRKAFA